MATRDQAQRDATTVEIGYALLTAALLAGVTGVVFAGPILILDLHGTARGTVTCVSLVLAGGVFAWRLFSVLRHYDSKRRP